MVEVPPDHPSRTGCALVTGSSRGIGAACARALAADGWRIGVNYVHDAGRAETVVGAIAEDGGEALAIAGDVASVGAADEMFETLERSFGPVLVLVNNAGITADGLAARLDDDRWERVIDTNLSGAFRMSRRAIGPMLRARFGRIVNIASVSGLRAVPGQANYAASKAGVIALTRALAVEVAKRGVTVNAIAPGVIETDMTKGTAAEQAVNLIPMNRCGTPAEVAACVSFLASLEASYVTGVTLPVDGGMTA